MSAAAILKPQSVGFSAEQVTALAYLVDTQAATKSDLEASEHRLELKIEAVKSDVNLLKWMMGFLLAGMLAILLRLYVH